MTAPCPTGTYLDRILARTAETVAEAQRSIPPAEIARRAADTPAPLRAIEALAGDDVGIIAEFKRASPSRGTFPVTIEPTDVAAVYVDGGVRAISCLTDGPFFQGSLDDLDAVVAVTRPAGVPVLRKDFMISPYQIDEARAHGAALILLIVACLDDVQLRDFRQHAEDLGMTALVEVHDDSEADRAVASGAALIGVNNRDLRSFDVSLGTSERLIPQLRPHATVVAESGIVTRAHVEQMAAVGAQAVLIGESLIVQDDRSAAVRALAGVRRG